MKRTSIFAPLLLIGLGALFLARNVYPEIPLLDYLAKYWPFVLVFWGVLRIGEILFWAATSKPLPTRGVSGGEWALVVLLCIFGGTLHAARGFYAWLPTQNLRIGGLEMFGESYDYPLNPAEKQTGAAPRVVIEGFRGNARITGADTNTVKVAGRQSIRSLDQSSADRSGQASKLEILGEANVVTIRTNQDKIPSSQRVMADLEIQVPKGAQVEAHGRYGDFDIKDVGGNVEVVSDNAGVRMENIGGNVRVDLRRSDIVRAANVKGSVEVKGRGADVELENILGQVTVDGSYTGMLQLSNLAKPLRLSNGPQTELTVQQVAGEIRMPLGNFYATNLVGPVRLTTRSRDVQISGVTNSVEVTTERGDIDLRPGSGPTPKIDLRTRNGSIELALVPGSKFDLNASTGRGNINNDFGAPLSLSTSGNAATLKGSNGGPEITIRSDRGEITVRKATPGEVAPPKERSKIVGVPFPPEPPRPPDPGDFVKDQGKRFNRVDQ